MLFAVMVFAGGVVAYGPGPTPTATPTPTPTPLPLQASGWEEVTVHALCLEVEQSYPEIEGKGPEPIAWTAHRILAGIGVEVVPEETQCDATLTVTLTGRALWADYYGAGHCYTGAKVEGQMALAVLGREPFTLPSSGHYHPPVVSGCVSQPFEAPFEKAWTEALLDGLAQLWGPQVLMQALGDEDADVRAGAAYALGGIAPEEAVPTLIRALADEDGHVRAAAADALREIGPEAKEAVPALIQALGDEDELVIVRAAAAWALGVMRLEAKEAVPTLIHALRDEDEWVSGAALWALPMITGQDFGYDAAAWQEWWEEQE